MANTPDYFLNRQPEPNSSTKERCTKCGNVLELPPSLLALQASRVPEYVTFNTSIDRTIPICRYCEFKAAVDYGSEIPNPYEIGSARKVIEDKLEKSYDYLESPHVVQETQAQLKHIIPQWEFERIKLQDFENQIRAHNDLQKLMGEINGLIAKGICVVEMKQVRDENYRKMDEFFNMLERKGFRPYWAIWGFHGERIDR